MIFFYVAEKGMFPPVTLNYDLDLDRVKLNQRAKYLGQRSFRLKVETHRHTQWIDCSTRLKVVGNNGYARLPVFRGVLLQLYLADLMSSSIG